MNDTKQIINQLVKDRQYPMLTSTETAWVLWGCFELREELLLPDCVVACIPTQFIKVVPLRGSLSTFVSTDGLTLLTRFYRVSMPDLESLMLSVENCTGVRLAELLTTKDFVQARKEYVQCIDKYLNSIKY